MGLPSRGRTGLNHIALEGGDIDEALDFYGRLFKFKLRGKNDKMAFIDLGDQFVALQKGRKQPADDGRHFGLVVDDKQAARRALIAAGVSLIEGPFLDFRDPWGNRIEIVDYGSSLRRSIERDGHDAHGRISYRMRGSGIWIAPRTCCGAGLEGV